MAVTVDLRVENEDWIHGVPNLQAVCQSALDAGAEAATASGGQVDVLLTDDSQMQALNTTWRGKAKPTDVLSFVAEPEAGAFLGDIAIGFGVSARDAAAGNKTLTAHLSHLLIHGLLHLLGHDHIEDDAAEIMEALERTALSNLGFDDPYSQITPN